MRNIKKRRLLEGICIISAFLTLTGCITKNEDEKVSAKPVIAPGPSSQSTAIDYSPRNSTNDKMADFPIVEVDEERLMFRVLNQEVEKKMASLYGRIPPDGMEQAKMEIRNGIIDDFILRTLLKKEISRQKIKVDKKEVDAIQQEMQNSLPVGVTIDDVLKKNNMDGNAMRDEIAMNIQINKIVMAELKGKSSASNQEISDYYIENRGKFTKPETVHARHLLIAVAEHDSQDIKKEKRSKAEELRRQLIGGADFATLAKNNSDCPSKEKGGDLGIFSRGQMVEAFEAAAFSQKKGEIGPIVVTEFGFHIIQVLEKQKSQVVKLDEEVKRSIASLIEQKKQREAFARLVKRLKSNANIIAYGQGTDKR